MVGQAPVNRSPPSTDVPSLRPLVASLVGAETAKKWATSKSAIAGRRGVLQPLLSFPGASPMNRRCRVLPPALCRRARRCSWRRRPASSARRLDCTIPDRSVAVASAAEPVDGSYRGVAWDPHVGRFLRLGLQPRGPFGGAPCRKWPATRHCWAMRVRAKSASNATGNGLALSVLLIPR